MSTAVIVIAILVIVAGVGYYFYAKNAASNTSAATPSPSSTPSLNSNMIGVWEVNQVGSGGSLTDDNYTLNFTAGGQIIPSTNNFPLSNPSWTSQTWSGINSNGTTVTVPLTFDNVNKRIGLYVNNQAGAQPFLVLVPTPSPSPSPSSSPSPSQTSSPTPSATPATTSGPSTTPVATSTPTPVGQFVPTSPPSNLMSTVAGRYIQLTGSQKNILNICRVEIFPSVYGAPIQYGDSAVTASSIDTSHKSLLNGWTSYLATKGTEIPSIKIDLGQNSPIYKIIVYNRVDDYTQRICGMTLSIIKSDFTQVYLSSPVMCPQIKKDGTVLVKEPISQKYVFNTDASGNPITGPAFDDYSQISPPGNLGPYLNYCGTVTYFPTPTSSAIAQDVAMPIFRGVWFNADGSSKLIMNNSDNNGNYSMTLVGSSINSGFYSPYGENAYVRLNGTPTVTSLTPTTPPPPSMSYNSTDASITFQNVKYKLNTVLGWYNKGGNANVKLNVDGTITNALNSTIGTYTLSPSLPYFTPSTPLTLAFNPYIGSWRFIDNTVFPSPMVLVVRSDMKCTDGTGTYSYIFTPGTITPFSYGTLTFTNNAGTTYKLTGGYTDNHFNGNPTNYVTDVTVTKSGKEPQITQLLLDPFYGTWSSNTLKKQVTFNGDGTITNYGIVNGYSQDQYWVNPPNSNFTSIAGVGYITGHIQGNTNSGDNFDIAYNIDLDIIYLYIKNSYSKTVDILTHT
uniref:Uncharacterized protein n=1 Tax=viral metagenome TaxID=1070528 RepID=A0A6C0KEV2_9ZZZZ